MNYRRSILKPFVLLLVFLLASSFAAYTQQRCKYKPALQTKHWIFGYNLGLEFNYDPTRSINEFYGQQINNYFFGRAAISDSDGNLLFYTDGINMFNSNHDVMTNGWGYSTSTYSTILIVPSPAENEQYFVFFVETNPGVIPSYSLYYAIVDMSLNNGLGGVTQRRVFLFDEVSERLTAVHHRNGTDIWVVTHGFGNNSSVNNRFFSFLVTADGISTSPVSSQAGMAHQGQYNEYGYMKISPQGDYIACAINGSGIVELLMFNNETGQVGPFITALTGYSRAYGVEFSPDSRFLYFTTSPWFSGDEPTRSRIYQYNIFDGSVYDIDDIGRPESQLVFGALQLGLDSKIYVTMSDRRQDVLVSGTIGVINNPKRLYPECNYVRNGFQFTELYVQKTLPIFVQSYFDIPHFTAYPHCDTDLVRLELWNTANVSNSEWDLGGGVVLNGTTFVEHVFPTPGNYTVSVTESFSGSQFGPYQDEITIYPLPSNLIPQAINPVYWLYPNTTDRLYAVDPALVENYFLFQWYYLSDTTNSSGWGLPFGSGEFIDVWEEGFYRLVAEDLNCCISERTIEVRSSGLRIPNAFRPGSTSVSNTVFRPYGGPVYNYSLLVYDRWGKLIFEEILTEDLSQGYKGTGWNGYLNGTLLPLGVYAYYITFDVLDAQELRNITQYGTVTLVR